MPLTQRRALACHGCGTKTNHKVGSVRYFICSNCGAENYFDKKGEIADIPAQNVSKASSQVCYVRSGDRSPSPPPPSDDNDIFCETCLKNQYLLKETLASYLPPEDDPNYEHFLASYDDYRNNLEQRYPQICSRCAPKARERIKKAAYLARSDHLRRMMDRTRHGGSHASTAAFLMSVFLQTVGLIHVVSLLLQALWHVVATATNLSTNSIGGVEDVPMLLDASESFRNANMLSCTRQTYQDRKIPAFCNEAFHDQLPTVLLVSCLTIWWNPKLHRRFQDAGSIITHLQQYYTLQFIVVVSRVLAMLFLDPTRNSMADDATKGAHLFMAMFLLSSLCMERRIVKLEYKNPVSFQLPAESLLPNVPQTPDTVTQTPLAARSTTLKNSFSIDSLAAPLTRSVNGKGVPKHSQAFTTADVDDPDAMDWTPTSKESSIAFNPRRVMTRSAADNQSPLGPSPFHGTLPAAPIPPAHRLRMPPSMTSGAFRMASDIQKNQFATDLKLASASNGVGMYKPQGTRYDDSAYDTDASTTTETEEERRGCRLRNGKRANIELAPPKFWAQDDLNRKTGLEDIFEEGFNINDTPKEVLRRAQQVKAGSKGADGPNGVQEDRSVGGFGESHGDGAEAIPSTTGNGWWTVLAFGSMPVACLGIAVAVVKGGYI